jgi:hypothetical protein
MGGNPVVKLVKKNIEKIVRPTSNATQRRPEVQSKSKIVKKTVPESTTVSRTKLIRSTRKKNLDTTDGMTEVASVRNKRKILLGDTGSKLG